jgi:beta-lactamase superfamily II metal-dependent hydrolase
MASKLRVRVYNIRFGDAILVSVPDRDPETNQETLRHILIDVGNVLNKEGGVDTVFRPVMEHIIDELNGKPLDLYVMTHEHLDHAQGLYYVDQKVYQPGGLKQKMKVEYAWLTASAAENYYDTHPEAKKQKKLWDDAFQKIESHLNALPAAASAPFEGLLANNNPRSTDECVKFLRNLAPGNRTFYVHRQFDPTGKHPFREARFEIWAPEEDTSAYYKSLMPMVSLDRGTPDSAVSAVPQVPPAGVDAGAFYDLIEWRESGLAENILAIDKAANNTSVVFLLEWRGKRLLFAGDAELGSWRMMQKQNVLKPVDFLKVSHHGSHNGTPDGAVLDAFLPKADANKRTAVISTWEDTYPGIPDSRTNDKLRERSSLKTMLDQRDSLYFDVEIGD